MSATQFSESIEPVSQYYSSVVEGVMHVGIYVGGVFTFLDDYGDTHKVFEYARKGARFYGFTEPVKWGTERKGDTK